MRKSQYLKIYQNVSISDSLFFNSTGGYNPKLELGSVIRHLIWVKYLGMPWMCTARPQNRSKCPWKDYIRTIYNNIAEGIILLRNIDSKATAVFIFKLTIKGPEDDVFSSRISHYAEIISGLNCSRLFTGCNFGYWKRISDREFIYELNMFTEL